jgi:hypothetical protein
LKDKSIRVIFWMMVTVFVAIICMIFLSARFSIGHYFIFVSFPAWIIFMCLGVMLIILTLRKRVGGKHKVFLLLTGASAAGFLIFVVLHNLISAIWNIEEAVFFIIAVTLCPAGFLAGAIGTVTLYIKNKPSGYLN